MHSKVPDVSKLVGANGVGDGAVAGLEPRGGENAVGM